MGGASSQGQTEGVAVGKGLGPAHGLDLGPGC